MLEMTYQKANGEVIQRIRNTYPSYRVGQTTSMGWKVLSIKYNYNGKYYPKSEYDKLIDRGFNKYKRINNLKRFIINVYRELVYCLILLILARVLELLVR